jgi:hypothetical protein
MKQTLNRKQRRAAKAKHGWVPLQRGVRVPLTEAQIAEHIAMARRICPEVTAEQVRANLMDETENSEIWKNDQYTVHRRRWLSGPGGEMPVVHLSIRRFDRAPIRDWRDMQRIKNELVGPECEGIELYPAESRLMDTANSYHIWVCAEPGWRFPFGYDAGRVVSSESGGGAVQRPLDEEAA